MTNQKRIGVALITLFCVLILLNTENKLWANERGTPRSCPLKTPADWQAFLERSVENPKWVGTCEDGPCDHDFVEHVEDDVDRTLELCRPVIAVSPSIASCTENLRTFLPAWLRQHDSESYGFNVDNETYFSGQESADKPHGMMTIPSAIVAALPDQERVQQAARTNGWKYLTHDSALTGVRTFILVQDPADRFDQWILLNLSGKGDKSIGKGMPVSIVSVQKRTAAGELLDQVRIHFRDYEVKLGYPTPRLTVNETGNGKCYSCHASGMRQLIPRITHVLEALPVKGEPWFNRQPPSDFAYRRLAEFNKTIRRYGTNDWDGMIQPEAFGPALGESQGCVSCHNGESRGILTVATSAAQLRRKFVTELSMPPSDGMIRMLERSEMANPPLNPTEKRQFEQAVHGNQALAAEFIASRFPELKRWLLRTSCL